MPKVGRQKYCSVECSLAISHQLASEKSAKRAVLATGEIRLSIEGKMVPEHRLVYERTRGVKLQPWHYVTHLDGNKSNNEPANLSLRNKDLEKLVQETGKLPAGAGHTHCPKCLKAKDGWITSASGKRIRYCRPCEARRPSKKRARSVTP